MNSSLSLQKRAVIAVALTIGFYLMAVAIAVGLFFIPYAEWTYGGRLHIKLAFLCVAGGLSFADGHSETHKWIDPRTKPPLLKNKMLSGLVLSPNNPDLIWLQASASVRK